MPVGKRYRLTGLLLNSRRGLVLEVDGGGTWLLDVGRKAKPLIGQRVTVEGARSGFDLLDVDRIDRAG
ncbi:hypothetical protein D1610_07045 [Sphingomonas gilva]|uniref:Uncharacterized protein n=1 Tax=Sphingomonas gilva TaxID=2305907 RepID=A0A396RP91_9SPHN|nr:DUF5818 domain-containing protein [Sphingomonas gilva]RHW18229.1 hypothetical protein D1610_07045 [Sphingomonas gilva]